jgi:hypothetical protein
VTVGEHGVVEVFQQFVDGGRFVGHRVRNSVVCLCKDAIVADIGQGMLVRQFPCLSCSTTNDR